MATKETQSKPAPQLTRVPEEAELVEEAKKVFLDTYGVAAEVGGAAPGRVNVIGDHTDYCEGFVFPATLQMMTVVVGRKGEGGRCRVHSTAQEVEGPCQVEFMAPTPDSPLKPGNPSWANYVKGVVANFPGEISGFDAVVVSSVPVGAGLSSSAALEVATYTFLEALTGTHAPNPNEKAKTCQKAEHEFANVPCGIMDQLISTVGVKEHAVKIDCRTLETTPVWLTDPHIRMVLTNSNVRHKLSGSEYPMRRKQCADVAELYKVPTLRDVSIADLEVRRQLLDDEAYKRARHVVTENARVEEVLAALLVRDYDKMGKLLTLSHESLRDDFEVSCPEIEELVEATKTFDGGVYGTRMTGAGFGGSIFSMMRDDVVDKFMAHITKNYSGTPSFYMVEPQDGAHILKL